jgi:predicted Zn-dependent protease
LALAGAIRESGDPAGEAEVLARALAVGGDDPAVLRAAALSSLRLGDEKAAAVHIGKLALVGSGATPTLTVAEIYLAARRPHAALKVLQPAIATHGADARIMRTLGRALLAAGAPPLRAAAAFRAAMRADPDDVEAAVGFSLSLTATLPDDARGAADLAVRTLSRVLDTEPGHVGALLGQAYIARALGDPAGALSWIGKIPESHPARVEADNLKALTRLDREDPYAAVKIFREILAKRPDMRHVRLNLALALVKTGRSTDARSTAHKAVEGLPSSHPLVAHAGALTGAK